MNITLKALIILCLSITESTADTSYLSLFKEDYYTRLVQIQNEAGSCSLEYIQRDYSSPSHTNCLNYKTSDGTPVFCTDKLDRTCISHDEVNYFVVSGKMLSESSPLVHPPLNAQSSFNFFGGSGTWNHLYIDKNGVITMESYSAWMDGGIYAYLTFKGTYAELQRQGYILYESVICRKEKGWPQVCNDISFNDAGENFLRHELYEAPCNNGDYTSCFHLGDLYYKGEGVEQDYTTASELYEKACEGGYKDGCKYYKKLKVQENSSKYSDELK